MTKEQEETIDRLNSFKTIKILYGNTFAIHLEQLEQLQKDMATVLDLVKQQQEELEKYKYLYNKALSELVVADKIIDEMIEEYEFVHRANITNFCEDNLRKNACIQDCKACIKQYFEKKAGEK